MLDLTKAEVDAAVNLTAYMNVAGLAGYYLNNETLVDLHLTCMASPVQFEGTVAGYPTYFRARWNNWDLVFVKPGASAVRAEDGDIVLNISGYYDPAGDGYSAGSMPIDVACGFLLAGLQALRHVVTE